MSIPERIRRVVAVDPGATAVEFDGRSWTWGYLGDAVGQLDAALPEAGSGASMGLLARNRPKRIPLRYASLEPAYAAAVCLAGGALDAPTERELTAFARERPAPYEVPATIKIVDDLPRTPSMKVSRPALRDLLAAADVAGEQAATVRSGEKEEGSA